jgi:hypothetical protein
MKLHLAVVMGADAVSLALALTRLQLQFACLASMKSAW